MQAAVESDLMRNTKSVLVGSVLYQIPNFYRFMVLAYMPEQEGAKTWKKTDGRLGIT